MKSFALFGIIVLALSAHRATALRCYDCSSASNGYCAAVSSSMETECFPGFQCITKWTDYSIIRKCGPSSICNFNLPEASARCQYCNEDLCNSAEVRFISIPLILGVLSVILAQQVRATSQL